MSWSHPIRSPIGRTSVRVNTLKRVAVAFALALPEPQSPRWSPHQRPMRTAATPGTATCTRGAPATTSASCRSGSPGGPATGTSWRTTAATDRRPPPRSSGSSRRTGCAPTASPARRRTPSSTTSRTTTARHAHFSYSEMDNGCGRGRVERRPALADADPAERAAHDVEAGGVAQSLGDKPLHVAAVSAAAPATTRSAARPTASTSTATPPT